MRRTPGRRDCRQNAVGLDACFSLGPVGRLGGHGLRRHQWRAIAAGLFFLVAPAYLLVPPVEAGLGCTDCAFQEGVSAEEL